LGELAVVYYKDRIYMGMKKELEMGKYRDQGLGIRD
jgi:hypothetical protein